MSLHRISILLALLTFGLIVWGGHVNTTHSGMAFPDWPTSNANPMLTYAPSHWLMEGDKFWEHGHRLFASLVGLVTVTLTVFAWRATPSGDRPNGAIGVFLLLVLGTVASAIVGLQSMPAGFMETFMIAMAITLTAFLVAAFRSHAERRVLWLCLAAFAGVCLQGAFGGYTVRNHLPDWTSTTHGMLAEVFFMIVLAIVWLTRSAVARTSSDMQTQRVRWIVVGTWLLIGVQFLLGALTRHTDSWVASTSWPAWDASGFLPSADLWQYPQVVIHFVHRTMAYVVALMVILQAFAVWKSPLRSFALAQVALIVAQIWLGVGIIMTARGELVTTLHVMGGVILLAIAARMSFPFVLAMRPQSDSVRTSTLAGVRS